MIYSTSCSKHFNSKRLNQLFFLSVFLSLAAAIIQRGILYGAPNEKGLIVVRFALTI
jgi:hypothetical protein